MAYAEKTLRHQNRVLRFPFDVRVVTADFGAPQGSFARRHQGNAAQLEALLDRLLEDDVVDRVERVDWRPECERMILSKYFGEVPARCARGTAIYQYLFALDRAGGDYLLHADADMLFHDSAGNGWIRAAMDLMGAEPEVVVAGPTHPPRASTLWEWILGRRIGQRRNEAVGWAVEPIVSTRYFLLDRRKLLEKALPLVQRGSEPLERSMSRTLASRRLVRASWARDTSWAIHPKPHNHLFLAHLDELIWGVERGVFPFRRSGPHPWDLYCYPRCIKQWLRAIRRSRPGRPAIAGRGGG